jgi:phospholipid transport system substrate-binding protein
MLLIVLAALLLLMPAAGQAAEERPDPARMVEETAEEILRTLREERERLEEDPVRVYELVEELLLPRFDVQHSARLVLGRHAREASPEQRRDFTRAFYRFLVRNYAEGLLEYSNEEIRVMPTRGEPDPQRARVRTQVVRPGGGSIPVDYTLRWTDDGWKVYDVTIEGISYVTNFRNSFDNEIRRSSLDALIERLERRADSAERESDEGAE